MPPLLSSLNASQPIDDQLGQVLESIVQRIQHGHAIDLDALAAAYPTYAAQLRELVPAVEVLVRMGENADGAIEASATDNQVNSAVGKNLEPARQLGDFRIIRELGRGGMGTVFEAEQLTMGRRVALKVLPFAALAREKSLQRFRNEVRAAAALDHPNIVSVYSVGEERGIHYFAMQLIRGQTLADVIASQKASRGAGTRAQQGSAPGPSGNEDPTIDSGAAAPTTTAVAQAHVSTALDSRRTVEQFRSAARLGIQAADALQHAHDQGVLHRDIKPGNLMLDGDGKLYITDFGLARIEADAGITMTGDIVGTLRYMAPEQALAKRVVVDHRADVYSLGATLYELLTLEPAFGETDRSDLLKQIAFEDPRSLRALDRSMPAELETIVLKAMEKNPADRYAAAGELAEDLQRFLKHEPIKACRAGALLRLGKWTRRHKTIARATLIMLFIGGIGAVIASGLIAGAYSQEFRARQAATREKALAQRQQRRAELLLAQLQLQRGVALLESGEALGMLDLADARLSAGDAHLLGLASARLWAAAHAAQSCPLVQVFSGADELAFSPDGRSLAIAEREEVNVWNIASGRRQVGPLDLSEAIDALLYSPDGASLAAHAIHGVARVWDPATGQEKSPELKHGFVPSQKHDDRWKVADFSADGKLFATAAGPNGDIRVWNTENWQPFSEPFDHGTIVHHLAFSPDGKHIASLSLASDETLKIWDYSVSPPKVAEAYRTPAPKGVGQAALDVRNSRVLVQANYMLPAIHNVADFDQYVQLDYRWPLRNAVFAPDGKLLATGSMDMTLRLWNAETGDQLGETMRQGGRPEVVSFSPDGKLLASRTLNKNLRVWETATQTTISPPLAPHVRTWRVEFGPQGNLLAASRDQTTWVWRIGRVPASAETEVAPPELPDRPTVVSPDGRYRAAITTDGHVEIADLEAGERSPVVLRRNFIRCVAFNSDSDLIATGSDNWRINIWEAATGRLLKEFEPGERVYGVAFSPVDPRLMASAQRDGTVRIWNLTTGQQVGQPMQHEGTVWELAFDPSGSMLATVYGLSEQFSEAGRIKLWDVTMQSPYLGIALPMRPVLSKFDRWSRSPTLATFDVDGQIIARPLRGDGSICWKLPEPPADPHVMRKMTWLALGMSRKLQDEAELLSAEEWQSLRHELTKASAPIDASP